MSRVESTQHAIMAADYRAAIQESAAHKRPEQPKSILHNLGTEKGFHNFIDALLSAPDRIENLKPWSPEALENNRALLAEAHRRGVIKDTFREQLKERAKTLRPHGHFDGRQEVLDRYLDAADHPQHRIIAELPGKEGKGLFTAILPEEPFDEQTYSRNEPIMSREKQAWFRGLITVHGGMGVGGSGAKGLVKAGVKDLRVADPGVLHLKDDNRVADADVASLLENHAVDWTIKAWLRNPHLNIECITQRLGDGTNGTYDRAEFMRGADFFFEEVDDIREKVRLRQEAQRQGITVIMATDVGFGTVIEVQRPDDPIFPGLTKQDWEIINSDRPITFEEASNMATRIIGPEYIKGDYFSKAPEEGRSYWSQTGASADASAAAVVKTLSDLYDEQHGGPRVPTKRAFLLDEPKKESKVKLIVRTIFDAVKHRRRKNNVA
jgi:molybdopterin/thiamine biosynthesis adenylyltransferase